ncbi:substrate-binding periplasmic protein [Hydrogenophaga sp.]|uniref:substrate-binding periplasmic protein n=1 Tax=Hydrogenophaga sp. TaxID=1904254 RepID=UPI0035687D63
MHKTRTPSAAPLQRRPGLQRRELVAALALGGLAGVGDALAQTELSDLARIRERGVLKVAVYKDNAPFSDGPVADMQGLDVALAQALARELQLKLALLPFDAGENMNDDLRNMVWKGHYLGYGPADLLLQVPVDRYLMQENRQVLIFAPYMRQVPVLLHDTRTLPQVRQPEDLQQARLTVERGAGAASALLGYGGGLLRTRINILDSGLHAAQAVLAGQADAAYVLRAQAEAALFRLPAGERHWALTALDLPASSAKGWPVGMAIKSQYKELGMALESAMQHLRSSGEMLALFQQNGLTLTAP